MALSVNVGLLLIIWCFVYYFKLGIEYIYPLKSQKHKWWFGIWVCNTLISKSSWEYNLILAHKWEEICEMLLIQSKSFQPAESRNAWQQALMKTCTAHT